MRKWGEFTASSGLPPVLSSTSKQRRKSAPAYACDITYTTNNEIGFDYLRDNMVLYKQNLTQRDFPFAIVDEVDSILIDEARTPLIISGQGDPSTDLYEKANALVRRMRQFRIKEVDDKVENDDTDADYIVDEKARTTMLTASGIQKAESFSALKTSPIPKTRRSRTM